MYFDLNIPVASPFDRQAREKLSLILYRLSQCDKQVVAALNYTLETNGDIKKLPAKIDPPVSYPNLTVLHRVTIQTDGSIAKVDWTRLDQEFDLVAMRTSNRDTFEEACDLSLLDIVSLDTKERLAFDITAQSMEKARGHGIFFELCYAPGIRETTNRSYLYQLGMALSKCSQKEHLLVSSEAESVSEIRHPFDVFYL
ncbi:PHP domain-like protein [Hesseltinella vesiculosa]|uniref:PHP domain-like protein n=1 Tax=Hesseltinella vesiculosa TaxID=101127 RepID=A0A1X2GCM8_9FUNG|nr:PHP domain-like protein [Hesseltinella vesiculosa]